MGPDLKLWSKLDIQGTRAAIVQKDCSWEEWQIVKVSLGKNKEIFNTELWEISEVIKIAKQKTRGI